MRGIIIKLSVFEYDLIRSILLDMITDLEEDQIIRTACKNILKQFEKKAEE